MLAKPSEDSPLRPGILPRQTNPFNFKGQRYMALAKHQSGKVGEIDMIVANILLHMNHNRFSLNVGKRHGILVSSIVYKTIFDSVFYYDYNAVGQP